MSCPNGQKPITINLKIPVSGSKPPKAASTATGKKLNAKGSRQKKSKAAPTGSDELSDSEPQKQSEPCQPSSKVYWDKEATLPRTDRLIEWLEQNPAEHQKLFSDSAQDAREENRPQRVTKGAKSVYHQKIAEYVFSVDNDAKVRDEFSVNPVKYSKSVENRIQSLKLKYHEVNHSLGATGAGLTVEQIRANPTLLNVLDKLTSKLPWWERLHGFWRTLPNFNPVTVSSEPGQDLVEEARGLLVSSGPPSEFQLELQKGGELEQGGKLDDGMGGGSDAEGPKEMSLSADVCESWSMDGNMPAPPDDWQSEQNTANLLKLFTSLPSFSSSPQTGTPISSISISTPTSGANLKPNSKKLPINSKRACVDSLVESSSHVDNKVLDITSKQLDYKMQLLSVKCLKYMADLEMQKRAAEEWADASKEWMQEKEHW